MIIYSAIDILNGHCVRLYQGDFNEISIYEKNPLTAAQAFAEQGASFLHVVDLDGAKEGRIKNLNLIKDMVNQTGLKIQTGGGIRNINDIQMLLKAGVTRVVLGSIAVADPTEVKKWLQEFGSEAFVLAFDIKMNTNNIPVIATHGWQKDTGMTLWEMLEIYSDSSLRHILCTDISCDGTLQGANIALYKECVRRYPKIFFQASGGIATLTDIETLYRISISGVILGKALYEKKFSLLDALMKVQKC